MDRTAMIDRMKAQLDRWNAEIETLEARSREAYAEGQAEWDRKLEEMKSYRDEAQAKLEELRKENEGRWAEVQERSQAAWKAMSEGFEKAADALRGSSR